MLKCAEIKEAALMQFHKAIVYSQQKTVNALKKKKMDWEKFIKYRSSAKSLHLDPPADNNDKSQFN